MRSIERRFRRFSKKHILLGDYANLRLAVIGMRYTKRIISTYFNLLIPREDYNTSERMELLEDLNRATQQYVPRSDKNRGKNALKQSKNEEVGISTISS